MTTFISAQTLPLADIFHMTVNPKAVMAVTTWITGFLCLLNIGLAVFFRTRQKREVITYYLACVFELAIFVLALLILFNTITQAQVPFHLPSGLPFNLAELAAALAIGIGLFPAAYWHRINLKDLPRRIAEDGKTFKADSANVRVRQGGPNEWMN